MIADLSGWHIRKSNGDLVEFSEEKLRKSLYQAKANKATVDAIIEEIKNQANNLDATKSIFNLAYKLLKKHARTNAACYNLKRGILQLGPGGYLFERLVGRIFEAKGYNVSIGQIVAGRCVNHEMDVIGHNGKQQVWVECKFRNQAHVAIDIKTALYVYARFDDVFNQVSEPSSISTYLLTNVRFTLDAEKYAICTKLNLIGWNYPQHAGIKDLIDAYKLYPLTCLSELPSGLKKQLLALGYICAIDLISIKEKLIELGLKQRQWVLLKTEIEHLCEI